MAHAAGATVPDLLQHTYVAIAFPLGCGPTHLPSPGGCSVLSSVCSSLMLFTDAAQQLHEQCKWVQAIDTNPAEKWIRAFAATGQSASTRS
jgi:hypothetical protein